MRNYIRRTALASIALLMLLGSNAAFASTPQTLAATTVGGVTDLGTQLYLVNGGQVVFAMIAGQPVDPTTATITYDFVATQQGMTTKGTAHLQFNGNTATGPVAVKGTFNISNNVPGGVIGTSELPFFFVTDTANVQLTAGGATQAVPETLQIESPYFNPFGAPIVIASADNSIVIAATYTKGNIVWAETKVSGSMFGTLGTNPASGTMTMASREVEDLVKGTAIDAGQITFSSMTPSSLNKQGFYTGSSTIPTTGTIDCSATTGIPGTCTETGFQSTGKIYMPGVTGTYTTTWGVPALGFSSQVSATVSQ